MGGDQEGQPGDERVGIAAFPGVEQCPAQTRRALQINPASEPPRIVWNSGAQPIIRWGFRRIVRTFMAAGPRMYGRWFYAGVQMNNFVGRGRVTGVPQRLGTSYSYPRFQTGPRVIPLGPK